MASLVQGEWVRAMPEIFTAWWMGAVVSAVFDTDQKNAAYCGSAVCDGAQIFDDPLKLIDSPAVDAVLIASPDETHSVMTLACLKAGKPVLC